MYVSNLLLNMWQNTFLHYTILKSLTYHVVLKYDDEQQEKVRKMMMRRDQLRIEYVKWSGHGACNNVFMCVHMSLKTPSRIVAFSFITSPQVLSDWLSE